MGELFSPLCPEALAGFSTLRASGSHRPSNTLPGAVREAVVLLEPQRKATWVAKAAEGKAGRTQGNQLPGMQKKSWGPLEGVQESGNWD